MEQDFDIKVYLDVLRRRYLYFLIPAILLFAATVVVAYLLPRVYEATATILVESQQIPTDLASPTVTINALERIQALQQRITARDNLLQVAGKFNLYEGGRAKSPSEIAEQMREDIVIEPIDLGQRSTRRDMGVIGFKVSFQYSDPATASRVANELVSLILAQNLASRRSRASETSKFMQDQLRRYEEQLSAQEQKIADFKQANEAELPETMEYRRAQLAEVREEIAALDATLRQAEAAPTKVSSADPEVQVLLLNLEAKKVALESYREEYEQIAPVADKGFVTRKRVRDLERQIAIQELDIEAAETQIAAKGGFAQGDGLELLKAQRSDLALKASSLEQSIGRTPLIEAQLSQLIRDTDSLREEYGQAQAKLADAVTGERLEEDRQSERFEIIEQAIVPSEPIKPDRPRIILAGAFGAMAFGAGLVVLMEILFKSVRTAADLERRLQLKPIAVIPYVATRHEQRRGRWRLLLKFVLFVGAVAALLWAVHQFYLPLDLVLQKITRQLGI